jgi:hypothetical protein
MILKTQWQKSKKLVAQYFDYSSTSVGLRLPVYLNINRMFDIVGKLEYTWIAHCFISSVSDISEMEEYTPTTSAGP